MISDTMGLVESRVLAKRGDTAAHLADAVIQSAFAFRTPTPPGESA